MNKSISILLIISGVLAIAGSIYGLLGPFNDVDYDMWLAFLGAIGVVGGLILLVYGILGSVNIEDRKKGWIKIVCGPVFFIIGIPLAVFVTTVYFTYSGTGENLDLVLMIIIQMALAILLIVDGVNQRTPKAKIAARIERKVFKYLDKAEIYLRKGRPNAASRLISHMAHYVRRHGIQEKASALDQLASEVLLGEVTSIEKDKFRITEPDTQ